MTVLSTVTAGSYGRIPPHAGMYILLSALFELLCVSIGLAMGRFIVLQVQQIIYNVHNSSNQF